MELKHMKTGLVLLPKNTSDIFEVLQLYFYHGDERADKRPARGSGT